MPDLRFYDITASTNDVVRSAVESLPDAAAVIAREQTAGRGRLGRRWLSPRGGLWMTMLFRAFSDPRTAQPVTIAAGLAIRRVLADCLPDNARLKIKWPNDIYYGDSKLAGILIETTDETDGVALIIGIGINVNNRVENNSIELAYPAASCAGIAQREFDIINLAGNVAGSLAETVSRFRLDPTLIASIDDYARASYGYGRNVRVSDAVFFNSETNAASDGIMKSDVLVGIERGIDSAGRLLIDRYGQHLRVVSGSVRLVG